MSRRSSRAGGDGQAEDGEDATGAGSRRPGPREPRRVVSLVPSLTEALFELGLGERVVGVTEWCVHPAEGVAPLPKVGGTKNPDREAIVRLEPDLVIANHEENTRRDVERLQAAGLAVWVTYPRTVAEGAALLEELAELGAAPEAVARVVEPVRTALAEAVAAAAGCAAQGEGGTRFFCPIWRDPWMAVGPDTYADDLLRLCGGVNVFAPGERRAGPTEPGRRERRYPRVALADVEAARPEVILLPDEPYAFGPRDVQELARLDVPAARERRIHLVDGTWVSWYGPRIAPSLWGIRPLLTPGGGPAGAALGTVR